MNLSQDQKKEKAIAMLQTGDSAKNISRACSLSLQTVYELIEETGLRPVRRMMDDDTRRRVALYYMDHTLAEVADEFGISVPTVLRCVKRFGLTREGKAIHNRGWFYGPRDRQALGMDEEKVQAALKFLARLRLAPTVDEQLGCMHLVFAHPDHPRKQMHLTVTEAMSLLTDPELWLNTNASRVRDEMEVVK